MKKIYVILSVIMLCIFILAGCRGIVAETSAIETETETALLIEEIQTETPIETSRVPGREAFNGFCFGTWENGVYTNETLDIRLTIPQDGSFHIATVNDIAEMMQIPINDRSEEEILSDIRNQASVVDTYSVKADGSRFITIMFDSAIGDYTVDEYLSLATAQIVEQYKTAGTTEGDIHVSDIQTAKLGNAEYRTITMTVVSEDKTILNQAVFVKENKGFFTNVVLTTADGALEEMSNMFN